MGEGKGEGAKRRKEKRGWLVVFASPSPQPSPKGRGDSATILRSWRSMKTRTTNRTTEITIERRRSFVVRRIRKRSSFCPICARDNEFVTPEEAAAIASVTLRTIYRWLEEGRFHFIEPSGGEPFICSQSVPIIVCNL